jgi:hypothetical protein
MALDAGRLKSERYCPSLSIRAKYTEAVNSRSLYGRNVNKTQWENKNPRARIWVRYNPAEVMAMIMVTSLIHRPT